MPSSLSDAKVEDLGMGMVEGVEVMGKRYTMKPPGVPKMPAMPQAPTMPQAPGAPAIPAMPKPPAMPKVPSMQPLVTEIWSSTKLKMPVLTTVTGAFGQTTCIASMRRWVSLRPPRSRSLRTTSRWNCRRCPKLPQSRKLFRCRKLLQYRNLLRYRNFRGEKKKPGRFNRSSPACYVNGRALVNSSWLLFWLLS